jgi:rare lipoprotein A
MLCAALTLAVGCGKRATAHAPASIKNIPADKTFPEGWTESGVASWYGVPYDGRKTSSGEIFDMRALTAAHRTLPFDTWVEVTNLTNGKQVTVRVNDRGPFVGGRIIDLSMAAADEIDMVRAGIAQVKLKVIRTPKDGAKDAAQKISGGVAAAEDSRGSAP